MCKNRGIDRTYEGETCRSVYLRGQEHLKDYKKKNDKSVMYKHVRKEHKNEETQVQFRMEVVGRFKHPMNRQIDEGIRIQRKHPDTLLNSKAEFHGPVVRRKVIEGKVATRKEDSS